MIGCTGRLVTSLPVAPQPSDGEGSRPSSLGSLSNTRTHIRILGRPTLVERTHRSLKAPAVFLLFVHRREYKMSYDQLSSLESGRRGGYSDNPEFRDLQYELKNKLQSLLSSNRKLANDVNVLGSKKDTPRLRERVHNTMEKTREICRQIGEGIKKFQTWEDLSVSTKRWWTWPMRLAPIRQLADCLPPETTEIRADKGFERLPNGAARVPRSTKASFREGEGIHQRRPR